MEIKYIISCNLSTFTKVEVIASSEEEAIKKVEESISANYTFDDVDYDISYKQILNGTKTEVEYARELDRTFIFRYTYRDGELVEEQLLGFYCGEPNEEATKIYSNGSTIIRYE